MRISDWSSDVCLPICGRLAVVSFHSTEDRIVKNFLRERSGGDAAGSRHLPAPTPLARAATFETPARKIRPGKGEEGRNPRARSGPPRRRIGRGAVRERWGREE